MGWAVKFGLGREINDDFWYTDGLMAVRFTMRLLKWVAPRPY